jgi:hypothetical protein
MIQDDFRNHIIQWSTRFPIDRWFRRKYNIPFNSPAHRESNFIDQLLEWEEEQLFEEFRNSVDYIPNTGDWIKQREITLENLSDSVADFRNEFKDVDEDVK